MKRSHKGWVPVTEDGKPWFAHFRKRKKDIPRRGWDGPGDDCQMVDLHPVRAVLRIAKKKP